MFWRIGGNTEYLFVDLQAGIITHGIQFVVIINHVTKVHKSPKQIIPSMTCCVVFDSDFNRIEL